MPWTGRVLVSRSPHQQPPLPRRLALRVGVPVAITAAAAAAAVVAVVVAGSVSGTGAFAPTRRPAAAAASSGSTLDIATAAYTLTRQPHSDFIRITLHASAAGTVDPGQLQRDLARLGLRARVTRGAPQLSQGLVFLAQRNGKGDFTAGVSRRFTGRVPQFIVFSRDSLHVPGPDWLTISVPSASG